MAVKRGGLGSRNLDYLLSQSQQQATATAAKDERLTHLPIHSLQPGVYQPRRDMREDALEELADSIRSQGIIQPIVVRNIAANQYEIVAGERRWRAALLANLPKVPVVIRDLSDEAALAMALIENIQRENLNPIEEAVALQRLMKEFELTHEQAAQSVGKSRSVVTNLLRLLSLQEKVKVMLENGDIEMGHARALLTLEGLEQIQAAQYIVAKELTVRETEAYLKRTPQGKKPKKVEDPDVVRLEQRLSDTLGAKVTIQHQTNGKGKLAIKYNSVDELEGILEHIK